MVFQKSRVLIKSFAGRAISIAGLVASLSIYTNAQAIPVGLFSWDEHGLECAAELCGPVFSVGNFSDDPDFSPGLLGDSFVDVFVSLQTGDGPLSLALDMIDPGNSRQSIEDLFGVDIISAALRLTFTVPGLPGVIQLLDDDGNAVTALTGPGSLLIDFVAEPVAQVPEPSILLLFGSGLIGAALTRRKRSDQSPGERA